MVSAVKFYHAVSPKCEQFKYMYWKFNTAKPDKLKEILPNTQAYFLLSSYSQILNVFVFVTCIQMLNILAAHLKGFKPSLWRSTILKEVARTTTVITPVS